MQNEKYTGEILEVLDEIKTEYDDLYGPGDLEETGEIVDYGGVIGMRCILHLK